MSGPPTKPIRAMVKSRYIGDGHPTFNRNPYNWYIKPYYWVDDHPLLYGNNGSLDPRTYVSHEVFHQPRCFTLFIAFHLSFIGCYVVDRIPIDTWHEDSVKLIRVDP